MQTSLKATNLTLTEGIEHYVEEKLTAGAARLLGKADAPYALLSLELARATKHHQKGMVWRAEATLQLAKHTLRAEAWGEGLHEAIDLLADEVKREIKRFKGKADAKERRTARVLKKRMTIARAARPRRRTRTREEGR